MPELSRRNFFKGVLGLAGTVAVAPLVSGQSVMSAAAQAVGLENPVNLACPNNMVSRPFWPHGSAYAQVVTPTMAQRVQLVTEWAGNLEADGYPGLKAEIARHFLAESWSLPISDITRLLSRVSPMDLPLEDGWTHHAWAVGGMNSHA